MATLNVQEKFDPSGAHTQNATLNAAVTLTPPNANSRSLLMQCTGQNVRFTLDVTGTTPTATVGFLLYAGEPPLLVRVSSTVKVIEVAATATLIYQWGA
jgi:hypothetical protein